MSNARWENVETSKHRNNPLSHVDVSTFRRLNLSFFVAFAAFAVSMMASGCAVHHRGRPAFLAAWNPGVEIRFPACAATSHQADPDMAEASMPDTGDGFRSDELSTAPHHVGVGLGDFNVSASAAVAVHKITLLGSRPLASEGSSAEAAYTLTPGKYAFAFCSTGFRPVYGEISIAASLTGSPRIGDFLRHSSITLTPCPTGCKSVLSASDLDMARDGEVVTKVVFMADLAAVENRLDDIDRSLREIDRVRESRQEQLTYWTRRLSDRRLNTRYSSDFGWGIDVPSADLALLQALVGPERYHWHRFSQAEDQVRTHEEFLAQLDLPERRLRDEREALRQLSGSVDILHRSGQLIVLAPSMIRPYHDPVDEVRSVRGLNVWADRYRGKHPFEGNDWVLGGKRLFPYWYSSLAMRGLPPGLRSIVVPSAGTTKRIGEVLMVVTIGSRRLRDLPEHVAMSR